MVFLMSYFGLIATGSIKFLKRPQVQNLVALYGLISQLKLIAF